MQENLAIPPEDDHEGLPQDPLAIMESQEDSCFSADEDEAPAAIPDQAGYAIEILQIPIIIQMLNLIIEAIA